MELLPSEIHVWSTDLNISDEEEQQKLALLAPDECERAARFRFPNHRQRYIAARATLRQLLGMYLNCLPESLSFIYTEHQKPFLTSPDYQALQFNLAHSDAIAIYAFNLNHAIGIDIEKVQGTFNQSVAERYFSEKENQALNTLSNEEKLLGFYRIWSRKEAIVKAVGKGFSIPLASFSVSATDELESITLENKNWSLLPLTLHPHYQSALACNRMIETVKFWRFFNQEIALEKVIHHP